MIRAGESGEREQEALSTGNAVAGWAEVGDLSAVSDRETLRDVLRDKYPDASPALISNWTGQLWRFVALVAEGDFVVLPLKTQRDVVFIGRVTGSYYYEATAPAGAGHRRPVEWVASRPRVDIEGDLLDSLGSLLTICQLTRHDAARRIAAMAAGAPDPGWSPAGATVRDLEDREAFFTRALDEETAEPLRMSTRQILRLWGASRRTDAVVAQVEADLTENGLAATPSIGDGWLDNVVEVVKLPATPEQAEQSSPPAVARDATQHVSVGIGTLEAATGGVVSVGQGDSLTRAITLMVQHDYSQLAVVDASGFLVGAVSWRSIGRARLATADPSLIQCSTSPRAVFVTDDLLGVVSEVSAHDFVFVRDHDSPAPIGVVTVADTTVQFEIMSRPFALIEEAERRLRRRVDEVIPLLRLREATKNPALTGASALTLGSYGHVLVDRDDFELLAWALDHEIFLEMLERVRVVRNELMHFSTDPLGDDDMAALQAFVGMLSAIM